NILLQIMDNGKLTDNTGRAVDFTNTIIIMTSNVGAKDITKAVNLGFSDDDDNGNYETIKNRTMSEVKKLFTPEFINRLDEVIVFHPLSKPHVRDIVKVMFKEMQDTFRERRMQITLTDSAIDCLVDEGYNKTYGARPMRRAIQKFIEDPLAI